MPQSIEIPGVGMADFPDDATPEEIQQFLDENYNKPPETSALAAAGRSAATGVLPGAAFMAAFPAGAKGGAAAGALIPGLGETGIGEAGGALVGGMITGGIAAYAASKAQQKALQAIVPEKAMELERLQQADIQQHPVASALGEIASLSPTAKMAPFKLAQIPLRLGLGAGLTTAQSLATQGKLPDTRELLVGTAMASLYGEGRFGRKPAVPHGPATPEEQATRLEQAEGALKASGVPYKVLDTPIPGHPDDIARTIGGTVNLSKPKLHEYLEDYISKDEPIEDAINRVVNHEAVHGAHHLLPDAKEIASDFAKSYTSGEKRLMKKILFPEAKGEISDEEFGQEAIRFWLEKLTDLGPSELVPLARMPQAATSAKLWSKIVGVVGKIRRMRGTEASARQQEILNKVENNAKLLKETADAEGIREDQRQLAPEGQELKGGKADRGYDVEQAPPQQPESVAERAQVLLKKQHDLIDGLKPGEYIVESAVMFPGKKPVYGPNHPDILQKIGGPKLQNRYPTKKSRDHPIFGYVTNMRKFVPRTSLKLKATGKYPHSDDIASVIEPPKPVAEQQPVEPTPGSVQSKRKYGANEDDRLTLAAVVGGTKPMAVFTGVISGKNYRIMDQHIKAGRLAKALVGKQVVVAKPDKIAEAVKSWEGAKDHVEKGRLLGYTESEIEGFTGKKAPPAAQPGGAQPATPAVGVAQPPGASPPGGEPAISTTTPKPQFGQARAAYQQLLKGVNLEAMSPEQWDKFHVAQKAAADEALAEAEAASMTMRRRGRRLSTEEQIAEVIDRFTLGEKLTSDQMEMSVAWVLQQKQKGVPIKKALQQLQEIRERAHAEDVAAREQELAEAGAAKLTPEWEAEYRMSAANYIMRQVELKAVPQRKKTLYNLSKREYQQLAEGTFMVQGIPVSFENTKLTPEYDKEGNLIAVRTKGGRDLYGPAPWGEPETVPTGRMGPDVTGEMVPIQEVVGGPQEGEVSKLGTVVPAGKGKKVEFVLPEFDRWATYLTTHAGEQWPGRPRGTIIPTGITTDHLRPIWNEMVAHFLTNADQETLESMRRSFLLETTKGMAGELIDPDLIAVHDYLEFLETARRKSKGGKPQVTPEEYKAYAKTRIRVEDLENLKAQGKKVPAWQDRIAEVMRTADEEARNFATARGIDITSPDWIRKALKLLSHYPSYKKKVEITEESAAELGDYLDRSGTLNQRRIALISELYHRMISKASPKNPRRTTIDIHDLDWTIKPEKYGERNPGVYIQFLPQDQNRAFLNQKGLLDALSSGDANKTLRVTVLRNKETGDADLVSTYRDYSQGGEGDIRIYNPEGPAANRSKQHVRLDAILGKYEVMGSMLLEYPVSKFHQRWVGIGGKKTGWDHFWDAMGREALERSEGEDHFAEWIKSRAAKTEDERRQAEVDKIFGSFSAEDYQYLANLERRAAEDPKSLTEEERDHVRAMREMEAEREELARKKAAEEGTETEEAKPEEPEAELPPVAELSPDQWAAARARMQRLVEAWDSEDPYELGEAARTATEAQARSLETRYSAMYQKAKGLWGWDPIKRGFLRDELTNTEADYLAKLYARYPLARTLEGTERALEPIMKMANETNPRTRKKYGFPRWVLHAMSGLDKIAGRTYRKLILDPDLGIHNRELMEKRAKYWGISYIEAKRRWMDAQKVSAWDSALNALHKITHEPEYRRRPEARLLQFRKTRGTRVYTDFDPVRQQILDLYGDTTGRDIEQSAVAKESELGPEKAADQAKSVNIEQAIRDISDRMAGREIKGRKLPKPVGEPRVEPPRILGPEDEAALRQRLLMAHPPHEEFLNRLAYQQLAQARRGEMGVASPKGVEPGQPDPLLEFYTRKAEMAARAEAAQEIKKGKKYQSALTEGVREYKLISDQLRRDYYSTQDPRRRAAIADKISEYDAKIAGLIEPPEGSMFRSAMEAPMAMREGARRPEPDPKVVWGPSARMQKAMAESGLINEFKRDPTGKSWSHSNRLKLGRKLIDNGEVNPWQVFANVRAGRGFGSWREEWACIAQMELLAGHVDMMEEMGKKTELRKAQEHFEEYLNAFNSTIPSEASSHLAALAGEYDLWAGSWTSAKAAMEKRLKKPLTQAQIAAAQPIIKKVKEETAASKAVQAKATQVMAEEKLSKEHEIIIGSALKAHKSFVEDLVKGVRKKHPRGSAMAMAGAGGKPPELDPETLKGMVAWGGQHMAELSSQDKFSDAFWREGFLKEWGDVPGAEQKIDDIFKLSQRYVDDLITKVIGAKPETEVVRERLTRKVIPVERSAEVIKNAVLRDPKGRRISTAEAKHLWNYMKQKYLSQAPKDGPWPLLQEMMDATSRELGLYFEKVAPGRGLSYPQDRLWRALRTNKSRREVTSEMADVQERQRRALYDAQQFMANLEYPNWVRVIRKFPRWFFISKVWGHGLVGQVTHASPMAFNPYAWKVYYLTGWPEMYKLAKSGSFLTPKGERAAYWRNRMRDLETHERYQWWLDRELEINPYRFADDYSIGQKYKFISQTTGGIGFDALKIQRLAYAEKIWDAVPLRLRTEAMGDLIAKSVNHATGIVGRVHFHESVNWLMFAPKLVASQWAWLVGDTMRAAEIFRKWSYGKIRGVDLATPEEKWWAMRELKEKLAIVGVYGGLLALNQGFLWAGDQKQKINFFDPSKSDFWMFKGAGYKAGIGTPIIAIVRLISDIAHLATGTLKPSERRFGREEAQQVRVMRYIRGKASPIASVGADLLSQQQMGRPLPWSSDRVSRSQRLRGEGRLDYPEWALETGLPIPFEEAVKEIFRTEGMPESWITRLLRVFTIAGTAFATGVRISPDVQRTPVR